MATSLPPVIIPPSTWVDLYDETGITIGVQLVIQNTGGSDARLSESATEPDNESGYNTIIPRVYLTNQTSAVGAWGFSDTGTTLQVEEA